MVSRVPQYEDDSTNAGQGNGPQAHTQTRDGKGQGHGTPRQAKQEAGTPKPTQDVAELKDYVCYSTTFNTLCKISELTGLSRKLGTVWAKEPLAPSIGP